MNTVSARKLNFFCGEHCSEITQGVYYLNLDLNSDDELTLEPDSSNPEFYFLP